MASVRGMGADATRRHGVAGAGMVLFLGLPGIDAAYAGEGFHRAFEPAERTRSVFFTSFDLTERGRFVGSGVKYAPAGRLEDPGWRILSSIGVKIRDYDRALGLRTSRVDAARFLLGHEWRSGPRTISAFLGLGSIVNSAEIQLRTRRTTRQGPAGIFELWQDWGGAAPWGSRFTSVFALGDWANRSAYFRVRHGFALAGSTMRIGPEIAVSMGKNQAWRGIRIQDDWLRLRLGVHLGEIPIWRARLTLSTGAEWRDDAQPGLYLQIGAYLRY